MNVIEIVRDLSAFKIPILDGDIFSVLLSSVDEESNSLIYKILTEYLAENIFVFKASGMPVEINSIMKYFKSSLIHYYEGDATKIFIKRQPEFFVIINNFAILKKILGDWVSTVYERRYIYILNKSNYNNFEKILIKNVYKDSDNLSEVWSYINGIVENSPDAPNHNTFLFSLRKKYQSISSIMDNMV